MRGCGRKHATAPRQNPARPGDDAGPRCPFPEPLPTLPGAGSPEVGCSRKADGARAPGSGCGVERRLRGPRSGFRSPRSREGGGSVDAAKQPRSGLHAGRPDGPEPAGGLGERGDPEGGAGQSAEGRGGAGGALAARPYLVQEQLQLGGAGMGDRGRIHVPAAPRGSARRPAPLTLHAPRPAGRGGSAGVARARLRGPPHLLPPQLLRLTPGPGSRRRRCLRLPAPAPPRARPRPTRQTLSAPVLTSPPHGRAPQILGSSDSGVPAGRLPGSARVGLSLASGNLGPHPYTGKAKG